MRRSSTLLSMVLIAGIYLTSCGKQHITPPAILVDAGLFQTVHLPIDAVSLTGEVKSGQDQVASYSWTLISGPNSPSIVNANTTTANVSGLIAGTYIFQFKAQNSNGTNVGLDTTGIVVFGLQQTDNSILSLLTGKQWVFDSFYVNYTVPGSGVLEYARGASNNIINADSIRGIYWPDGRADNFDNSGKYNLCWYTFINADSTEIFQTSPSGSIYTRILRLDQTHLTFYDSTDNFLDVMVYKP